MAQFIDPRILCVLPDVGNNIPLTIASARRATQRRSAPRQKSLKTFSLVFSPFTEGSGVCSLSPLFRVFSFCFILVVFNIYPSEHGRQNPNEFQRSRSSLSLPALHKPYVGTAPHNI